MTTSQPQCSRLVQDTWGARVQDCGTNFDFTLLFEEIVLTIGPIAVAILSAACRIFIVSRRATCTASHTLGRVKLTAYTVWVLLQVGVVGLVCTLDASRTRASIATACVTLVGVGVLGAVSRHDHYKSPRASTLLCLYLGVSIPADVIRVRTLFSMPHNAPISATVCAVTAIKALVFTTELMPKKASIGARTPADDEKSNIFSRALLWWFIPLLRLGYHKLLTMDALPNIELALQRPSASAHSRLRRPRKTSEPLREQDEENDASVLGMIALRWPIFLSAVPPRLLYSGFTFAQPFLVERATSYMTQPDDVNTYKVGGGLIAACFIVYTGLGTSQAFYRQCTARWITASRTDLVHKIYARSLALDATSPAKPTVVTLMSADVERFSTGVRNIHECWAGVLDIAVSLWLLVAQLGVASAAAGGMSAFFILVTFLVVVPAGRQQNRWLRENGRRTSAVMQGLQMMRGLKMTGATPYLRKSLLSLRIAEMQQLRRFRLLLVIVAWSAWIPTIMAPILTFTIYNVATGPATGQTLIPSGVFRALTLFAIYSNAVAALIEGLLNVFTAIASLSRIASFLRSDNFRKEDRELFGSRGDSILRPEISSHADDVPLIDLSRFVHPGNSTPAIQLLRACARPKSEGSYTICYATMEMKAPAIVAVVGPVGSGKSTLLRMLLGEVECVVGSVTVSNKDMGYCSQEPWLAGGTIRSNIVGPRPFDAQWYDTVIRATSLRQDLDNMPDADDTTVGSQGSNLSGGQQKRVALARAIFSKNSLLVLDDPFNGLDGRTERDILEALFGEHGLLRRGEQLVIWATSSVEQTKFADQIFSISATGEVTPKASHSQPGHNHANQSETGRQSHTKERPRVQDESGTALQYTTEVDTPAGDLAIYKFYVGRTGAYKMLLFTVMSAMFAFGMVFSQVWIARWAENNVCCPNTDDGRYIGVYFAIGSVQLLGWTGACYYFISAIAEQAADRFHKDLLDTILHAPMSFFGQTETGTTINRFSQDLLLIDSELPINLIGAMNALLPAIGQVGVLLYGSPWTGLSLPVVAGCIYLLELVYLRTSRQLRLLQISAKAPILSNLVDTLNGLPTIRALRWTASYASLNQKASEGSQQVFFLQFSSQNWLNLVLDMITAGLTVTIMAIGVGTRSGNSGIGLALFSASSFSIRVRQVIELWTQLEITMGAVARVRDFMYHTAREPSGAQPGSKSWPGDGCVTFTSVVARYSPSLPPALNAISFRFESGYRYAICGRTGSGKSTLVATLLRLLDLSSGSITVDGVDTSTLDPDELRRRFVTLPQVPLLIAGTVRDNMQLHGPQSDESIIDALTEFQLWEVIKPSGGLDAIIDEALLTQGQRQLLCLARSTLQTGNLVILDEPSSQLDDSAEEMMLDCIRTKFSRQTVLCVAHSLSTVMICDVVVVMDAGTIVETGDPRTLSADEGSRFASLMAVGDR